MGYLLQFTRDKSYASLKPGTKGMTSVNPNLNPDRLGKFSEIKKMSQVYSRGSLYKAVWVR